jgi:1,4-dihydroxy-2-naphthoate polyprenyltransferase
VDGGEQATGPRPGWRTWLAGARPRTLPAAVVPVLVGTAAAAGSGDLGAGKGILAWRVAAALVVALALQVGTNYANDYSDGVRGTDDVRVGPVRLVASGLAAPGAVKRAALASFAAAGLVGLALAAAVSWWLLAVGAASIAAGWLYTGGPRPYGYLGLGEVFVFVFFGLVATVGSSFVQREEVQGLAVLAAVPVGFLATALLVVNNLRDIPTDTLAGKRTLAVHLGDRRTRHLYAALVGGALGASVLVAVVGGRPAAALAVLAAALAWRPVRAVLDGESGPELIAVLGDTGRLQLAFGALLALGLWLSA